MSAVFCSLHKVLFMENVEQYCNKDNWPPEGDRGLVVIRLYVKATDVNIFENNAYMCKLVLRYRNVYFIVFFPPISVSYNVIIHYR